LSCFFPRCRPGCFFCGVQGSDLCARWGLAAAIAADPEGEANDGRLLPQLLERARVAIAGPPLTER